MSSTIAELAEHIARTEAILAADVERCIESDMEAAYDDMVPNTMLVIVTLLANVASDEVALRFAFLMGFHEIQWNDKPEWDRLTAHYNRLSE